MTVTPDCRWGFSNPFMVEKNRPSISPSASRTARSRLLGRDVIDRHPERGRAGEDQRPEAGRPRPRSTQADPSRVIPRDPAEHGFAERPERHQAAEPEREQADVERTGDHPRPTATVQNAQRIEISGERW